MPVKSYISSKLSIDPLKEFASLSCISVSPFVFINVFPTKYALKLASGMFTFCPNPIIGKQRNISSSFFTFNLLF